VKRRRRAPLACETPTTHEERVFEVWSRCDGTTGDAVRWALAQITRLEREVRRLNAELDAMARENAIAKFKQERDNK
jgi:antitoxin component of MazEF toxin-antitoxin module